MQTVYLAGEPLVHVLGHLDESLRLLELMLAGVHQLRGRCHFFPIEMTSHVRLIIPIESKLDSYTQIADSA